MSKEYTSKEVLSIIDFTKGKTIQSKEILLDWMKDRNNKIETSDEHGLSVVGIFEHPIFNKSNKEIGKIIIFNYTGVGGGYHNDIYKMVENKYFSNIPYYRFTYGDNNSFYYRFFLTGDIFSADSFNEWIKPNSTDRFRVFSQDLPNSELIIVYDASDNREGSSMKSSLGKSNSEYSMYYDDSICQYYIKNIDSLEYLPSKQIIERKIKERIDSTQH